MEELLEYQKTDGELLALQREISKKSNKEESNNLYGYVKNAQTQTIQYDEDAKKILDELNKLLSVQAKGISLMEKYAQQDLSKLSPDELKDLDNKIAQASANLAELENRINVQSERAKRMLQECETVRKRALVARQKYQDNKTLFENLMKEKEPDIQNLKKQLEKLQHNVDPALFSKYKTLRQDGIFPAVVPLVGTRCGGCRMEMPSNTIDRLKEKGHIECEQCRRIIYLKKE